MTSGLPQVSALKRFRSLESRQGKSAVRADNPVSRDSRDEDEGHVPHTATGALIAGHGS